MPRSHFSVIAICVFTHHHSQSSFLEKNISITEVLRACRELFSYLVLKPFTTAAAGRFIKCWSLKYWNPDFWSLALPPACGVVLAPSREGWGIINKLSAESEIVLLRDGKNLDLISVLTLWSICAVSLRTWGWKLAAAYIYIGDVIDFCFKYLYFLCGSLSWYVLYILEEILILYFVFLCTKSPTVVYWKSTELPAAQVDQAHISSEWMAVFQMLWHSVFSNKVYTINGKYHETATILL